LDLSDLDIILGINWLHSYRAKIGCKDLKVIFNDDQGQEVCFYWQRGEKSCPLISTIKASKLSYQGILDIGVMPWIFRIKKKQKKISLWHMGLKMFFPKSYQHWPLREKFILRLN